MNFLKRIFPKKPIAFSTMLANGVPIIDVRMPGEFREGHYEGAVNIPLPQVDNRLEEIRQLGEPVIICCASGMRSAHVTSLLRSNGIEAHNAGSWKKLEQYKTQPS